LFGNIFAGEVLLAIIAFLVPYVIPLPFLMFEVFVGFMQALALIPGASRSGVTITAGLFAGLEREAAARFSFLLSIPAVTAAGIFELKDAVKAGQGGASPFALLLATIVSFAVGYACIAFLMRFLRTRTTYIFSIYRIVLAATVLIFMGLHHS